jgi:hypothetical protein
MNPYEYREEKKPDPELERWWRDQPAFHAGRRDLLDPSCPKRPLRMDPDDVWMPMVPGTTPMTEASIESAEKLLGALALQITLSLCRIAVAITAVWFILHFVTRHL